MIENMNHFGAWGMGFGWLFMLIFWGLVIVGFVTLVKWIANSNPGSGALKNSPIEILKARYARGEIDREEFEQKKRDLEQ